MKNFLNESYKDLAAVAQEHQSAYRNADPFPCIAFTNFFNPEMLKEVRQEFPDLSESVARNFDNALEKKLAGSGEDRFGGKTKFFMHYLNSQPFLEFLQALTGIDETLIGDPYYQGGGLHEIKRGGLLKIHSDFNQHPDIGLDRRINVLVYLNREWKEEYGGSLELWDRGMSRCEKKILPEFNTLAMFSTTDYSYHGHPDPLNCPDDMSRKSLALYYYTNGRPVEEVDMQVGKHNTLFRKRNGNAADKEAFSARGVVSRMKSLLRGPSAR